jgi:hypothetical protein
LSKILKIQNYRADFFRLHPDALVSELKITTYVPVNTVATELFIEYRVCRLLVDTQARVVLDHLSHEKIEGFGKRSSYLTLEENIRALLQNPTTEIATVKSPLSSGYYELILVGSPSNKKVLARYLDQEYVSFVQHRKNTLVTFSPGEDPCSPVSSTVEIKEVANVLTAPQDVAFAVSEIGPEIDSYSPLVVLSLDDLMLEHFRIERSLASIPAEHRIQCFITLLGKYSRLAGIDFCTQEKIDSLAIAHTLQMSMGESEEKKAAFAKHAIDILMDADLDVYRNKTIWAAMVILNRISNLNEYSDLRQLCNRLLDIFANEYIWITDAYQIALFIFNNRRYLGEEQKETAARVFQRQVIHFRRLPLYIQTHAGEYKLNKIEQIAAELRKHI